MINSCFKIVFLSIEINMQINEVINQNLLAVVNTLRVAYFVLYVYDIQRRAAISATCSYLIVYWLGKLKSKKVNYVSYQRLHIYTEGPLQTNTYGKWRFQRIKCRRMFLFPSRKQHSLDVFVISTLFSIWHVVLKTANGLDDVDVSFLCPVRSYHTVPLLILNHSIDQYNFCLHCCPISHYFLHKHNGLHVNEAFEMPHIRNASH